ncbi:hypothetical protein GU700_05820 [Methylobacterium sp. NI91]|nr:MULTISPECIES: hypothetical protein [unclassified Methylobacterium]QIJ74140.1 hypothetical protein CLZ_05820 [Methylobacterium sp. CLZ]QIJ79044.1 hypothetical protein GU700_05820 [Methylobacterium sp. NI91]
MTEDTTWQALSVSRLRSDEVFRVVGCPAALSIHRLDTILASMEASEKFIVCIRIMQDIDQGHANSPAPACHLGTTMIVIGSMMLKACR